MGKTAFLFPGQGSQYVGMAKDFYKDFAVCRQVFEKAEAASGVDVKTICFEENKQIHITEYTQIAMLTVEVAMLRAVEEIGKQSQAAAGLSLGEYGALTVSGAIKEEDVFYLIRKRGIFMQQAVPTGGAMIAVLGLDSQKIEEICKKIEGMVTIANYNCPGQTVITGEKKAVEEASVQLVEAGAKKCIPLKVSGPFHSPMLKEAGEKLSKVLDKITFGEIQIPYLSNVTADYVTNKNQIKDLLVRQVASSVRWQQSIERMLADGIDTFVEIGPGKTLSGFVKKINHDASVITINSVEDLKKLDNIR